MSLLAPLLIFVALELAQSFVVNSGPSAVATHRHRRQYSWYRIKEHQSVLEGKRRKSRKQCLHLGAAFRDDDDDGKDSPEHRQQRQINDRLRRRNQRKQQVRGNDNETTRSSTRQRPRQSRRNQRVDKDKYNDNDDYYSQDRSDDTNLRRRKRFQRRERQPQSVVTEMVDMGAKATRIAKKTTGMLWNGLLESTYDEEEGGYDDYDKGDNAGSPRRERRRSGFNWPDTDQFQGSRRRQRPEQPWNDDEKRDAKDYYSSNNENDFSNGGRYYSSDDVEDGREYYDFRAEKQPLQKESKQTRNGDDAIPTTAVARTPKTTEPQENRATTTPLDTGRKEENERQRKHPESMPIGQILAALDERDIAYSPKASRQELEDLLLGILHDDDVVAVKKAKEDIEVIEVEYISPEDWKRQQEEKLKKQKEQEEARDQQRKKKRKQATNNAARKDDPKATPSNFQANLKNKFRRTDVSKTSVGASETSRRPTRRKKASSDSNPSSRTTDQDGRDASVKEGRKVYSPFARTSPTSPRPPTSNQKRKVPKEIKDDFDLFGDSVEDDLDRVGGFLADTVDEIFWGNSQDKRPFPTRKRKDPSVENDIGSRNQSRSSKRHWKDRAEERLDRVMGIHNKGGKTYDRWSRQEELDTAEIETEGYDAIAYTRGKKRPRRSTNQNRRKVPQQKPFWEEEGSLLSVLLGNHWDDSRPSRRSIRSNLDDVFGSGITVLIRKLLFAVARVTSSLCRWASVGDTIPRPVVFLSAVGTGFVSRPGWRIKNMLLVFLSVRVFGEWLSEPERLFEDDVQRTRRRKRSDVDHEDDEVDDSDAVR